jgi:type IV pilus assembly protein PilM
MVGKQKRIERPTLACEVGADRVIAARATKNASSLDMYTSRRLATGAVSPSLASPNVLQGEALRQAITSALGTVASNTKDVIAVLPDAAVRVMLLEFDSLPEKREEVEAIIRFRVKKSLPFDVDHAALSFQRNGGNGTVKVIAALAPAGVMAEYEAAFRDCGYAPGVVLPSTLATLGMVSADRPTLVVKVDVNTTSVAIVDKESLILLRMLDHPGRPEVNAQELAENIHPSMVFFEDTYSSRIEQVLVTGLADVSQLGAALQSEIGVQVSELSGSGVASGESLGDALPQAMLTGVAGALLG